MNARGTHDDRVEPYMVAGNEALSRRIPERHFLDHRFAGDSFDPKLGDQVVSEPGLICGFWCEELPAGLSEHLPCRKELALDILSQYVPPYRYPTSSC
jgi:hypothetical protein